MEDSELLMKSFKEAGATVRKCKPGEQGGIYLNGQELTVEMFREIFEKGPGGHEMI